jgi:superfamily I DNA and/or RNA helicase
MWCDRGQRVPGVLPQEFFWDLSNNAEGRPVAGLSACNYVEAEAAAALTSYLILCGVPPPSISIITPYKGQMMCIRKLLQKAGAISFSRAGAKGGKGKGGKGDKGGKGGKGGTAFSPTSESTNVVVSTVDRYQGDENDVVILSLVRTKPGNRFVALHNREFI